MTDEAMNSEESDKNIVDHESQEFNYNSNTTGNLVKSGIGRPIWSNSRVHAQSKPPQAVAGVCNANREPGNWTEPNANQTPLPVPSVRMEQPIYAGPEIILPVSPIQYSSQVRFLNASPNSGAVDFYIDGMLYATNAQLSLIVNYQQVADGFHMVTIRRSNDDRVLYQQNFPFASGERMTMILIDTGNGNFDMIQVSATSCINMPYNSGCYRFVNASGPSTSFNLVMTGGTTIFNDMKYREITAYKQAMAGNYQFEITRAGGINPLRTIPIIAEGAFPSSDHINQPLLTFRVSIEAGENRTTYLLANNWGNENLQVITVED